MVLASYNSTIQKEKPVSFVAGGLAIQKIHKHNTQVELTRYAMDYDGGCSSLVNICKYRRGIC